MTKGLDAVDADRDAPFSPCLRGEIVWDFHHHGGTEITENALIPSQIGTPSKNFRAECRFEHSPFD